MGILGDNGWDEVDEGAHHCEIIDAEYGTSSTGNPTLIVRMIVDGSQTDMTVFSLLPQALFKVRGFLKMLGFDKESDPDADDLIGKEFKGIFSEDDQGRVRLNDWKVADDEVSATPKKADKKKAAKKSKPEPEPEADADEDAPAEEVSEGYSEDDLDDMKMSKLEKIADELEVDYDEDTRKSELIELILEAQKPSKKSGKKSSGGARDFA